MEAYVEPPDLRGRSQQMRELLEKRYQRRQRQLTEDAGKNNAEDTSKNPTRPSSVSEPDHMRWLRVLGDSALGLALVYFIVNFVRASS